MATITEDYVSFETAKLLKDKGFDEATNGYYNAQYDQIRTVSDMFLWHWNNEEFMKRVSMDGAIAIPTLQMAMKWLREVHDILIIINKDIHILEGFKGYFFVIQSAKGGSYAPASVGTPTKVYEDAVEAAIKYCLEHLI